MAWAGKNNSAQNVNVNGLQKCKPVDKNRTLILGVHYTDTLWFTSCTIFVNMHLNFFRENHHVYIPDIRLSILVDLLEHSLGLFHVNIHFNEYSMLT